MGNTRIVPESEGGRVKGVRLFGIRPDSLLGRLGLENGDRLESINGFDLTAPDRALEAYGRLRNAEDATVVLTRRGSRTVLRYSIV